MLKQGDIITLTSNPTIQIADYQYIKAGASVTRTIESDNPSEIAAEFAALEAHLKKMVFVAIAREIEIMDGCYEVVGGGTLEGLLEYCKKEIGDGESAPKGNGKAGKKVGKGVFGKGPKKTPTKLHGKGPGKVIGG